MKTRLFYGESKTPFVNAEALKALAHGTIAASPLMQLVYAGNRAAIEALLIGYWYFVYQFEVGIDRRAKELFRYRKQLLARFGDFAETFRSIAKAVAEMKQEEGVHAKIWQADALRFGISSIQSETLAEGVRELVESAEIAPLWKHYCVLGGTEDIAVALSERAKDSPQFLSAFSNGRFLWGETHLLPDPPGRPSHHEIDRDLARALYAVEFPKATDDEARKALQSAEADTIRLFGKAADDVYRLFGLDKLEPPMLVAAE